MFLGLTVEAPEPAKLAAFWAALLGWEMTDTTVRGPEGRLVFVPASGPKTRKNRLHPDLASYSPEEQRAKVERALALGASPCDIGQGDVPWVVLADPAGNEFCGLEPRRGYTTTESLAAVVVDSLDPAAQARFWSELTGWPVGSEKPGVIVGLRAPDGRGPWLEFLRTAEPKRHPNRLRPIVNARSGDPADQEGNEFSQVDSV
ncbi:VOC family protein [Amycolatopsis acididurans]|uniref:VOC family protein n=1 Tax=Amycolatopsis acididurans TaxID=2724524 RepID=UPI0028AEFAE9|nr:VOC family protein [Amycolatopsis acididurans]